MSRDIQITALRIDLVPGVRHLMEQGEPYIRVRTDSDYWLYAHLFSSTCPVALIDGQVAGAVIAFRSQDNPHAVYLQDVMTDPEHRKRGIAAGLVEYLRDWAQRAGCRRLYLTSEPDNVPAHATWLSLGFANKPGDYEVDGIHVITDYKGPGKDRAVYERYLDNE